MSNNNYIDSATNSVDDLIHQRAVLANAIGKGAVALGIISEGTPLTIPQLLMVLGDIIECASSKLNQKKTLSESEKPHEWTDEQCEKFLSVALENQHIVLDIEFDDIRRAVKQVKQLGDKSCQ